MKLNLIQLLSFAAANASWTFIPILAKNLGLSDTYIGFAVSIYASTMFFSSYLFGRASDKRGNRIFFLRMGLIASLVGFLLQIFINNEISLLMIRAIAGFCSGIFPAALVAYAYESKKNLGKFSAFGSLGWFLGATLGGIIAMYFAIKSVFIFSSLSFFASFLMTYDLNSDKRQPLHVPLFPIKIIKKNLSVYSGMFVRHLGGMLIWTFWPLYLQSLGANLFWVGVIGSINSLVQFFIMFSISDKLNPHFLIKYGFIFSAITFFLYSTATVYWHVMPVQLFLGVSWSFLYVGSLRYLTKKNVEKATVSAMLDSTKSLSSIIGPLLSIIIVSFGDYRTTMYIGTMFAVAGFIIFNLLESKKHVK